MGITNPRYRSICGAVPVVAVLLALQVLAQGVAQSVSPNYTTAQAIRGKAAYVESCASCHGDTLDGGQFGDSLRGVLFRQRWGGKPAAALLASMSTTMPPDRPGRLGDDVYASLLAYLLQENGVRPGNRELPSDPAALEAMVLPAAPAGFSGGLSAGIPLPPAPLKINPLHRMSSVSDATLNSPPDGDWLQWRRTFDAHGFSPLKQITRTNVRNLGVAWTWSLPNGPNEATPLVHDGVLFVHGYGDRMQALDGVTGDLLWQYTRRLPSGFPTGVLFSVKRGFAIYSDRLFVPTTDGHVVALDAKTGRVMWDHAVADPRAGFRMSSNPLVARGKVMVGTVGQARGGNFIVALDTATGEEAWRFNTVARLGEHGGNTWNGVPEDRRSGASSWVAGSYDPVLNLAFFGTGQTYDTGPLRSLVKEAGVTNAALYTDSTLAINPDTGKLVWYFQHLPNDQWDVDWAFERQLVRLPVNGVNTTVVITSGKQAITDALVAQTGEYLFSIDSGLQNIVKAIDPRTGAKTVDATLIPGSGAAVLICPHRNAGRSWIPTSYNATTKVLFMPTVDVCMDLRPVESQADLSTGVQWTIRPRPGSDGKYGRLEAVNLGTKKVAWVQRTRAPRTTGVLATAGGVVFAGAFDRVFAAYDATTGKELWSTRLNDVPSSAPITYMVNGKQYVAMVVGNGGPQAVAFQGLVPEIQNPPDRGAAIWVFVLR
jgi:alcohol dehydrogenase (cytochrome c)